MKHITFQLNKLARSDKTHAFATRADRARFLRFFGDALDTQFKKIELKNLSSRHLEWFLYAYRSGRLSARGHEPSVGTVKNMLSAIRWALQRIGKGSLLPSENAKLGIANRSHVAKKSHAVRISEDALVAIDRRNPFYGAAVRVMQSHGLRLEEALKLHPEWADFKTELRLEGSWCKNGRPRSVPTCTRGQVAAINHAKRIAGESSLIPTGLSYIQAKRELMRICAEFGLHHRHGLRHAYAQDRFALLAGFPCPVAGGPSRDKMTLQQQKADLNVRSQIARELGHGRPAISRAYLGSATARPASADIETLSITQLLDGDTPRGD